MESSSQRAADAKPSKLRSEMPCTVTWLTFTTPRRPTRALSSISFLPSSSGSYPKSRRNQLSFHIALGVQYSRPVIEHPVRCERSEPTHPPGGETRSNASCGTFLASEIAVELA